MSDTPKPHLLELRQKFSVLTAHRHQLMNMAGPAAESMIPVSEGNIQFEELKSVGYHPDLRTLEAIFGTKLDTGYGGNLCSPGSTAFVRFFLDYGSGWEDQGYVGVAEHDIPTHLDCTKQKEKPLSYSASLQITPKAAFCQHHVLPRVRAILDWNRIPTAGDPNYHSIWGNTIDSYIQIKPRHRFLFDENVALQDVVALAISHPNLKVKEAATFITGGNIALQQAQSAAAAQELELHELIDRYKGNDGVSAGRYALKELTTTLAGLDNNFIQQKTEQWSQLGINIADILKELENTNANVSYEELEAVGLDYNKEAFVATFNVKRPTGYSGDLCTKGSLEYVAFWADWHNNCQWEYAGYTTVNVHDINDIPHEGLTYAAILPYSFEKFKRKCDNPNVVKIRAVLSWAVQPSTTDPEKLEYWGNRKDAYIQLKPGTGVTGLLPVFNIIGGIPVDEINDATGLTFAGAKFALNMAPVNEGSPFGGIIVIQGPSFAGHRYRIKVTDIDNGSYYYVGNDFTVVGFLPTFPYVQYTNVVADTTTFYYPYQPFEKNTDNILARWSPGTNDLLKIELEIEGVFGVFTKYIQMDNEAPQILLQVNDTGDCTHFKAGDTITGSYYANDAHLLSYQLTSSFGGSPIVASGNSNTAPPLTPLPFSTSTAGATTPCGKVSFIAYEKTIYDSQWTGRYSYDERIICLQPA